MGIRPLCANTESQVESLEVGSIAYNSCRYEALGALFIAVGAVVGAAIFAVHNFVHWINNQAEASRLVQGREELAPQQTRLQEKQDHVQAMMEQVDEGRAGLRWAMSWPLP